MPFDGANDAVAVVERMEAILATPDKWCQGWFKRDGRSCIASAYCLARTGKGWMETDVPICNGAVYDALHAEAYARCGGDMCAFNNSTDHAGVLDFLRAVKARLAA